MEGGGGGGGVKLGLDKAAHQVVDNIVCCRVGRHKSSADGCPLFSCHPSRHASSTVSCTVSNALAVEGDLCRQTLRLFSLYSSAGVSHPQAATDAVRVGVYSGPVKVKCRCQLPLTRTRQHCPPDPSRRLLPCFAQQQSLTAGLIHIYPEEGPGPCYAWSLSTANHMLAGLDTYTNTASSC